MKAAGFPAIHRLEEYDVKRMAELDEEFLVELHRSDGIGRGDNVVPSGERPLPCAGNSIAETGDRALAHANGEGAGDLTDAIYLLDYFFRNGPAPTRCMRIEGCPSACRRQAPSVSARRRAPGATARGARARRRADKRGDGGRVRGARGRLPSDEGSQLPASGRSRISRARSASRRAGARRPEREELREDGRRFAPAGEGGEVADERPISGERPTSGDLRRRRRIPARGPPLRVLSFSLDTDRPSCVNRRRSGEVCPPAARLFVGAVEMRAIPRGTRARPVGIMGEEGPPRAAERDSLRSAQGPWSGPGGHGRRGEAPAVPRGGGLSPLRPRALSLRRGAGDPSPEEPLRALSLSRARARARDGTVSEEPGFARDAESRAVRSRGWMRKETPRALRLLERWGGAASSPGSRPGRSSGGAFERPGVAVPRRFLLVPRDRRSSSPLSSFKARACSGSRT